MKINTYNYTKGTKNIYDKKYHAGCGRSVFHPAF